MIRVVARELYRKGSPDRWQIDKLIPLMKAKAARLKERLAGLGEACLAQSINGTAASLTKYFAKFSRCSDLLVGIQAVNIIVGKSTDVIRAVHSNKRFIEEIWLWDEVRKCIFACARSPEFSPW